MAELLKYKFKDGNIIIPMEEVERMANKAYFEYKHGTACLETQVWEKILRKHQMHLHYLSKKKHRDP